MKYGMRERLSGAVILIALAVIFVPMLFDEPAPRGERPQPVMTIEQPVEVERRDVPDPEPPASLGQIQSPGEAASPPRDATDDAAAPDMERPAEGRAEPASPEAPDTASAETAAEDPIAELARAADQRLSEQGEQAAQAGSEPAEAASDGEWAVQVGSFGEPDNAERLETKLAEQGLAVYSRVRDSGLTTVYVGPFATSREGERVMGELKARENLQGLLVRADS